MIPFPFSDRSIQKRSPENQLPTLHRHFEGLYVAVLHYKSRWRASPSLSLFLFPLSLSPLQTPSQRQCNVLELDSGIDYRQMILATAGQVYLTWASKSAVKVAFIYLEIGVGESSWILIILPGNEFGLSGAVHESRSPTMGDFSYFLSTLILA